MSQFPNLILAAAPEEESAAAERGVVAHMSYRVEAGPRLMRLSSRLPGQGGLLYFGIETLQGANFNFFCQQCVRECAARQYRGVVADLPERNDKPLHRLVRQLDEALHSRGLVLYVPERFQSGAPNAKVLVSTALSGGSLRLRLQEAMRAYGPERVVPAAQRIMEDFTPPSRSGTGRRLSPEELRELQNQKRPNVFWSPELCARYFTYFTPAGQAHFVLYDDAETLRAKFRLAGELGIGECMAAWAELDQKSKSPLHV